jgi:hypothetical protein
VLFGWEKGWFIYTPVTVLFITGMLFLRRFPFRNAVLWFCGLNIWIIIAWDDWHYGATYSTRALMQSYPVFALPLAACIDRIGAYRWRHLFYLAGLYLIGVNFFQTWQYNTTVLHYRDMNRRYYGRIYLNPDPSPVTMSLLDTEELPEDGDERYHRTIIAASLGPVPVQLPPDTAVLLSGTLPAGKAGTGETWLKVEARIRTSGPPGQGHLCARIATADTVKETRVRLANVVGERTGNYAFYMLVPPPFRRAAWQVSVSAPAPYTGVADRLVITLLER